MFFAVRDVIVVVFGGVGGVGVGVLALLFIVVMVLLSGVVHVSQ